MKKEKVLNYIYKISPMAKEFVEEFYDNVKIIYEIESKDNEGVVLKLIYGDMCLYYASFNDDSPLEIITTIKEELSSNPIILPEVCFNVFGENTRIIEFVQNNNFFLDMEGHILHYAGPTPTIDYMCEIMVKEYDPKYLDLFVDLFDSAYEKLNKDNGWDTKYYSKNASSFGNELYDLSKRQLLKTFWKDNVLIGCYIIDGSYLRDIVVHPRFQSCGYGKMFLKHFLRNMREDKNINDIYLRITKSNNGAKRLYERNGFVLISTFAEHTYRIK